MHPRLVSLFAAAGLASLAQAFTQPGQQTWGPLLTPDLSSSVTQGLAYQVTWDPEDHPTDGVTVSLVLCHGPGSNCVLSDTAIAEGIPAAQKSYNWNVPCDLAPGTQSTESGYGMLIIVDGTGEFQYSTQFSVLQGKACGSSSPPSANSTTSTVTSTSKGIVIGPPAYATSTWVSGNTTLTTTIPASGWASASGTATYSYGGATYTYGGGAPGSTWTSAAVAGSTFTTAASQTTVEGATGSATGAAASASTFVGSASQIGRSVAGLVVAGAVAVFAL